MKDTFLNTLVTIPIIGMIITRWRSQHPAVRATGVILAYVAFIALMLFGPKWVVIPVAIAVFGILFGGMWLMLYWSYGGKRWSPFDRNRNTNSNDIRRR